MKAACSHWSWISDEERRHDHSAESSRVGLFCDEIEVRMVGVNVPLPIPMAYHSFGGWKPAMFGELHACGPDGVQRVVRLANIQSPQKPGSLRQADLLLYESKY